MFLIFAYTFSQSPAHMTACTYAWDKPPENTEKMAILPAMWSWTIGIRWK